MNSGHARKLFALGSIAFAVVLLGIAFDAGAQSADKAQIQALEEQLAAAIAAKDVDKVMQFYVPGDDLFVFDVIPPRQYVGAAAYRKDFEGFFATAASRPDHRSGKRPRHYRQRQARLRALHHPYGLD